MKNWKSGLALLLCASVCIAPLTGCGKKDGGENGQAQEKVFNYGTVAMNTSNGTAGFDPHNGYNGWSTIRYGVGETLFKFTESMELEPWLAIGSERIDDYTIKITLRDDVYFSNNKKMTGNSVKKCLEKLVEKHDRAPEDLKIKEIHADGQQVTIVSQEKVSSLLNYLSDPYACVIDVESSENYAENIIGTGPFITTSVNEQGASLVANRNYWGGEVKVDKVNIKSITDGDTLTMALQNGELDATQGLPYSSLELFSNNPDYKISTANTSRLYMAALNYNTPALQDEKVRQAIACAIDKEGFTTTLLKGNGTPAVGAFPSNFTFGNDKVMAPAYDPQKAKALLSEAGYTDTNGDGYVEKNGQTLTLRWLTYPSRQELPLLAESVQASLKDIGIKVEANVTSNQKDVLASGDYDVYASAFVAAPTGDPLYFFTTHLLESSAYNSGHYRNIKVEQLTEQLRNEFDVDKRSALAVQIQQQVLDDGAYVFVSHLKMSFVMKKNVTGFEAHPSDYYEITADLDIQ